MMRTSVALMLMVLCRFSSSTLPTAFITEKAKLIDKQGLKQYKFGSYWVSREIALNDDIVVIGSAGDEGTSASLSNQGSAVLFKRQEGNVPEVQTKLRPSSTYLNMSSLYYGQVVDANRNFVVVGAPYKIRSVFIYRAQYPFNLVTRIERSDLASFGEGLSISSDNTLVIGAPRSNYASSSGQFRGTVCIYKYMNDQGKDQWTLQHTLKPNDLQDIVNFGHQIASTRNYIVAVAQDYSGQSTQESTVYVYRKNSDGSWNLSPQKMTNPGNEKNSFFGSSVAVDERRLVIGAKGVNKVFVYELSGSQPGVWELRHTLTLKYKIEGDDASFGYSVALKGDAIAVGAPGILIGYSIKVEAGACLLFHFDKATGQWSEVAAFRASDMLDKDHFGKSVAMDEKELFVGSNNYARGYRIGAVYVYDAKPSSADNLKLSKWSVIVSAVLGSLMIFTTAY